MNVLERLPEKFKAKWLLVWLLSSIIATLLMVIVLGVGKVIGALVGPTFVFSVVVVWFWNVLVCLIGFFGMRHWFLVAELGLMAGGSMAAVTTMVDSGGWEAFVAVFMMIVVGILTGIIGMTVQIVVRVRRDKGPISPKVITIMWTVYSVILLVSVIALLSGIELKNQPDNLSTDEKIMDAEGAKIKLEFISGSFEKGGYYPYDNLSFKQVSDYIKEMMSKAVGEDESAYVQLEAVEHSDEDAIVIKLQEVISQQVVLPYFKKKHELFVNEV